MSQEIMKDPFDYCDSSSLASDDGRPNDQINNKLNLLLTNIERIDKNVLKLNQIIDMLVSKQTIIEITLSSINADYVNTREIIDKTETSCSKILSIIEERDLSYEHAIADAAQQIQTVTEKATNRHIFDQENYNHEISSNFVTTGDNHTYISGDVNNEPQETAGSVSMVVKAANDIIHAPFEPTVNNKRKTSENDLLQDINGPVPTLTITNPTTQESYQVYTEKYNRAKNAAETELLTGEKGFNHLLSFLFGAIFSNEELRESSINGTVKGTKSLCPQRVHTIDQHMYNIYGQRYSTYRQTKKFKDTINKKCCRLRGRLLD
ncbi:unnamed protein product [Didymodactylos carnosus]|uniref:Uncharacterized protein n=1 Tax=Didymodactylos carnosus TaxID=1234261 RepID=A0A814E2B6_9BILA|nr:unnamed protein product [Didymodactylos carnosus]CAF1057161.1 unnamed protein product [Didymodactylos carnosus]CAF3739682.1 unnamed protein product [Didymodactylos carnosus]CAF3823174.1 unnamed protein product [Didymodactylos carnosus]